MKIVHEKKNSNVTRTQNTNEMSPNKFAFMLKKNQLKRKLRKNLHTNRTLNPAIAYELDISENRNLSKA